MEFVVVTESVVTKFTVEPVVIKFVTNELPADVNKTDITESDVLG